MLKSCSDTRMGLGSMDRAERLVVVKTNYGTTHEFDLSRYRDINELRSDVFTKVGDVFQDQDARSIALSSIASKMGDVCKDQDKKAPTRRTLAPRKCKHVVVISNGAYSCKNCLRVSGKNRRRLEEDPIGCLGKVETDQEARIRSFNTHKPK